MKLIIEKYDLYGNGQERDLYIYESNGFKESKDKKILLAHDAHNIFKENNKSWNGFSWEVKEAMEANGFNDYLVFGLECLPGVERIREYSPVENRDDLTKYHDAKNLRDIPYIGEQYLESLFNKLIPEMESRFGFKFEDTKSIMFGSSMGGVITTFAASKYPDKFSAYLTFSNAFWANTPYIFDYVESKDRIGKYYHDMGGNEDSGPVSNQAQYLKGYDQMNEYLRRINADHMAVYDSQGMHREREWAKRLPGAIKWALSEKE